ncbi:MAG TPA: NAD(P)H-binding protein [Bacteroidia bacterium]|nr:NAD(P)H-binding protein [Bacteroidia bacterium]
MKKTAVVFGATGLTGRNLVRLLCEDERYDVVKIFTRKESGIKGAKIDEIVIDFRKMDDNRKLVTGDEVFCCLGTTIAAAGSEAAFRRVDFEWVRWCAISAAENGVKKFLAISSLGANPASKNFYLRTKGEMEKAVSAVNFEKCAIFRPSMLLGARKEFRFGELTGKFFMRAFSVFVPKKYKAVRSETVAKAMLKVANDAALNGVIGNELILALGK